jgi:hypothetical protein
MRRTLSGRQELNVGSKAAHEFRCGSDESTLHMESQPLLLTHIGGPTAMIEVGGIRLLTDRTFDSAGGVLEPALACPLVRCAQEALSQSGSEWMNSSRDCTSGGEIKELASIHEHAGLQWLVILTRQHTGWESHPLKPV